jgi:hypothetical protein
VPRRRGGRSAATTAPRCYAAMKLGKKARIFVRKYLQSKN